MADALFANGEQPRSSLLLAHEALNEMISKGNRVAEVRKSELIRLQELCNELAQQSDRRGLQALSLLQPTDPVINMGDQTTCTEERIGHDLDPGAFGLITPFIPTEPIGPTEDLNSLHNSGIFSDTGISSGEFLSIVDQMESQDIFSNGLVEDFPMYPSHQPL